MKVFCALTILVALIGITLACVEKSTSSPSSPAAATSGAVVQKSSWEQKWEATLAGARDEGTLTVYSVWAAEVTNPLRAAFKKKYGIELEFGSVGRGPELPPKVQAENRAGLYIADGFGSGASTLVTAMKPAGLLGPIEPLLILPEVTDPNYWMGGQVPFLDKDRFVVGYSVLVDRNILINISMIKDGEITSFNDLLKPQYKGKIVMGDPTLSGSANSTFSHLAYNVWNVEQASLWLRKLLKQQEAVLNRDDRLLTEWVARGKYPIALGPRQPAVIELRRAGAPIKLVDQHEGYRATPSGGCVAVPAKPAHPNAATVFINWLLSAEGQRVFALGYGAPSRRLDVSTEGIDPNLIISPQEKVFFDSEERIIQTSGLLEVARKILQEEGIK